MPEPLLALFGLGVLIALVVAAFIGWAALRVASQCDDEMERRDDEWLR